MNFEKTFYDLFAGIGGFRLGLERNGFKCVGSCEWNTYARSVYFKNFNEFPDFDANNLNYESMPDFDVLTAGFPCQAFSIAGNRKGLRDLRGNVFFAIAKIAKVKQPALLVLENVKGLLNHEQGRTFATILYVLYELGYDVEWQSINGKYFVPQNRERVFIIGHSRKKSTRAIFPIKEEDAISKPEVRHEIVNSIDSNYWKGIDNHAQRTMVRCLTEVRSETAKQIRREHRQKTGKDWCPRRGKELVARDDGLIRCLTTGFTNDNMLLDNEKVRKLTPLECERLMGFPDNWTSNLSDSRRYRVLGNSVIVPIIEYLGKQVLNSIES
jgi:DNA (cytosine-5)-methyltransferase 1